MADRQQGPDGAGLQNAALVTHIDRIRRQADRVSRSAPASDQERLVDLIQALEVSLEEMEVALEELQAQNDELNDAHQLIERERARYQVLFDLAPDGYLVTDQYGNVRQANAAALTMLGTALRNLRGKPFATRVEGSNRREFFRHLNSLNASRQPASWRTQLVNADGTALTVAVSAAPGPDSGTLHWLLHSTARQVEAEEAAHESEEQLRQVLETAGDAIISVSPDQRITRVNTETVNIFGYTAEQMVGRPVSMLIPERFRDAHVAHVQRFAQEPVMARKMGQRQEVQGLRRDGTEFLAEASIAKLTGPEGVTGFTVIVRDVSERDAARRESLLKRKRLSKLIETVPVGVLVVDADGMLEFANGEARRLLAGALPADDSIIYNEDVVRFQRPDGASLELRELPLHVALREGRTVRAEEVHLLFNDGHTTPVLIDAAPLEGADGKRAGALAVFQDLTPIEELERLRNDFLTLVSRDLRTPLLAIKGSVSVALDKTQSRSPAEAEELFTIINEQVGRLQELVDKLLDLTRIETGTLPVALGTLDPTVLVHEAVDEFTSTHRDRVVEIHSAPPIVSVKADHGRIRQVLRVLLDNAARFSPAATPISVSIEEHGGMAEVSVRDRGKGITPERTAYIFKKFSQLFEEGSYPPAGSGLGLAICKGIVEAHGGRIWVESDGIGQGSTFSFTLPLVPNAGPRPRPDTGSRPSVASPVSRDGRARVLVVENDLQTVRLVRRTLDEAGYEVLIVRTAKEGVDAAVAEEPDLCLLDFILPDGKGMDILGRLREFYSGPVLFMSGAADDDTVVAALKQGADDFIIKPFAPSELEARIGVWLRRLNPGDLTGYKAPYTVGGLTIDFVNRRVTTDGVPRTLTATEYRLLYELAQHPGRTFTHDELLARIWGPQYRGESHLLRSFIRNLRHKLGDNARSPRYIITEARIGYRLAD